MARPIFAAEQLGSVLEWACRRHYDEPPTAPCRAWFGGMVGSTPYVTIRLSDGEIVTDRWDGKALVRTALDRCVCGAEHLGGGAWWDETDRGEPITNGCAICCRDLEREAEEARDEYAVSRIEAAR
jgi:hypothetical protein